MDTKEEAAQRALLQEDQERKDWCDMLQSEAAFRCWLRLLREMGAARLMCCEEDMRMRNISDQILDSMADASPKIFVRMILALKHMEKSYGCTDE